MTLSAKHYWQGIRNNPAGYKSYIYLLFSILPVNITRLIRNLKSLKNVLKLPAVKEEQEQ